MNGNQRYKMTMAWIGNTPPFLIAVVRAYESYRNKKDWSELVKRAMSMDFSWKKSAGEYINLFYKAIDLHHKHKTSK